MEKKEILAALPGQLLTWYHAGHRDLPWRRDRQPYHIWLSEIMLQQTRVEAVKGYYARFLEACPTIEALAACDDDQLHKLWEGLGYYSRVRNLKKAAQVVMEQHGGVFPKEYAQVLALPGIGEYTAGAICSIAFGQSTPAVDGNVLRVYSRIMDDASPIDLPATKKRVTAELAEIYPQEAGDFTQALMELGATVCGPNRKPDCGHCPCKDSCLGYRSGTAEELPIKAPKKQRKKEARTVFILRCDDRFALQKRPDKGLLAGLWQFPNATGHLSTQDGLKQVENWGLSPKDIYKEVYKPHIFTHIEWDLKGIYLEVSQPAGAFRWFTAAEVNSQAALPTAFRQFWEDDQNV